MTAIPCVSVIVLTCDRPNMLRRALESLLGQTYPNVEVIVVDNGSGANTRVLVESQASPVIYLRAGSGANVASARNAGFQASSGIYVCFLDDDDYFLPHKIQRQAELLGSDSRVDIVNCGYYQADGDGTPVLKVAFLPVRRVLGKLLSQNFVWECFERAGGFDESIPSISADWDLWLRVALDGSVFACIQEPLGVYRLHADSMVADAEALEDATFTILERVFSDRRLPGRLAAQRALASASWRLWIACRYYAVGKWDDAERNLAGALDIRPTWIACPTDVVRYICSEALSPRVQDPFAYIEGVALHLPASVAGLEAWRGLLYGELGLQTSLVRFGSGDTSGGRRALQEAVRTDWTILERAGDLAALITDRAVNLPLERPIPFAETVLDEIERMAAPLRSVRRQVLSQVDVACAFLDFDASRRAVAARRVLRAVVRRPQWLADRGAVSVLVRSLPAMLLENRLID
jgi:glycosyltransferase involved in cell wall biosynthesis